MGVNYHQFAPRLGFAYALPDDKTVLRGGYGSFYSNLITLGGMQSLEVNPPNNVRVSFSTDKTKSPTILLSQGFAGNALSLQNATNVELISYDRGAVAPMAQQFNFDIQRQLPGGVLFEIGYYGNKFEHNWRQLDGNPAPPIAGKNLANPFGAILTAAMMLAHLGLIAEAAKIEAAVLEAVRQKQFTQDLGGKLNTRDAATFVTDRVYT